MARLALRWVAVALVAVGAGCSAKDRDRSLEAPSSLTATLVTIDVGLLSWRSPPGAEAIVVEGRVDGGQWLFLGEAPGDTEGATVQFALEAPEAATYEFRVCARRGTAFSPKSAPASLRRGVRPAWSPAATIDASGARIHVAWGRGSVQAEALTVERRVVPFDGAAGAWASPAALPLDATSYDDADVAAWQDGAVLEYRIVYAKGGTASEPAVARTEHAPPLAVAGLSATSTGPTSFRLEWTARSRSAFEQIVVRKPRLAGAYGAAYVAWLPAEATSYLDVVPEAGTYLYWVSAHASLETNGYAQGAAVVAATPLPDLPLVTSGVALPPRDQVARDGQGRFATAGAPGQLAPHLRISRQTASGWELHDTPGDRYPTLAQRGLLFGPDDRLHVLWAFFIDEPLHHEWLDGAWSEDTVATTLPRDAIVDAEGALHAVSCRSGVADYATNASGSWAVTRLPATRYADRCAIAVGPLGDVRVAYTSPREPPPGEPFARASDLVVLAGGGSRWTEELVPLGAEGTKLSGDLLRVFAPAAERTVLVYEGPTVDASDVSVRSVARDAGGWGAPVQVGTREMGGAAARLDAAMSPDGSRVAVAWNGTRLGSTATLAIRDASGAWSSSALHETDEGVAVGFSPAGKLWVLDGAGPSPQDALLYEER